SECLTSTARTSPRTEDNPNSMWVAGWGAVPRPAAAFSWSWLNPTLVDGPGRSLNRAVSPRSLHSATRARCFQQRNGREPEKASCVDRDNRLAVTRVARGSRGEDSSAGIVEVRVGCGCGNIFWRFGSRVEHEKGAGGAETEAADAVCGCLAGAGGDSAGGAWRECLADSGTGVSWQGASRSAAHAVVGLQRDVAWADD